MKNVSLGHLGKLLDVEVGFDEVISGYRIDSRLVQIGDLFFALKGARVDGHEYLCDARAKGAIGAVVERGYAGPDFGLELVRVENVEEALQKLARLSLEEKPVFVLAITGSLGKTTTKEFVSTLLEGKYTVFKPPGSYNSKLTLPLTVLNRGDEKVLVLEMGISSPGEMEKLVSIAPPDLAILTKISLVHAEFFPGGIDQIRDEKMKIFSHPKTKIAILPSRAFSLSGDIKTVSFSQEDREADYFLSLFNEKACIDEKAIRAFQFDPPFKQPHVLHNLLASIAACRQMHMEWEEIYDQISKLKMPLMRFEEKEIGGVLLINDAYNAAPDSMRAALSNLPQPSDGGKRIAVLASMKELGVFSEDSHWEVGLFAQKYVDHLITFGAEAEALGKAFSEAQKPSEHLMSLDEIAVRLKELMRPGDVVLLKGSRSMRLEDLLEKISQHGV